MTEPMNSVASAIPSMVLTSLPSDRKITRRGENVCERSNKTKFLFCGGQARANEFLELGFVDDEEAVLAGHESPRRNRIIWVVTVSRVVPIRFARSSCVRRKGITVPFGVSFPCSSHSRSRTLARR